jgi:hypothetical protein
MQEPDWQSEFCPQLLPFGSGPPHWFAVHMPDVHPRGLMQAEPSGWGDTQTCTATSVTQIPEVQSASTSHVAPSGNGPQVPVSEAADVTQRPDAQSSSRPHALPDARTPHVPVAHMPRQSGLVPWPAQTPDVQSLSTAQAAPSGSAPHVCVAASHTPETHSASPPHAAPFGWGAPQVPLIEPSPRKGAPAIGTQAPEAQSPSALHAWPSGAPFAPFAPPAPQAGSMSATRKPSTLAPGKNGVLAIMFQYPSPIFPMVTRSPRAVPSGGPRARLVRGASFAALPDSPERRV